MLRRITLLALRTCGVLALGFVVLAQAVLGLGFLLLVSAAAGLLRDRT